MAFIAIPHITHTNDDIQTEVNTTLDYLNLTLKRDATKREDVVTDDYVDIKLHSTTPLVVRDLVIQSLHDWAKTYDMMLSFFVMRSLQQFISDLEY